MNSKLLRYVVTVAELRSFSGAAKRLYLSQPSLSQSIISLEKELGTPLFDRSTVPLSLTFAGEKFVEAAQQILLIEHELNQQIGDIAENRSERLSVGVPTACATPFVSKVFAMFHQSSPGVNVSLVEAPGDQLVELALAGEIDLTFTACGIPAGFLGAPLRADRILLALGPGHPAAGRQPRVDLNAFREEGFVLTNSGTGLRKTVDGIFKDCGFSPKVVLETHSLDLALHIASASRAATFLPELAVPAERQLNLFRLKQGDYTATLHLCHRKNLFLTKKMKRFIWCARQVAVRPDAPAIAEDAPLQLDWS